MFSSRNECWPNGTQADKAVERDASIRRVTQVLCKAKLLGIVSGKRIAWMDERCTVWLFRRTSTHHWQRDNASWFVTSLRIAAERNVEPSIRLHCP